MPLQLQQGYEYVENDTWNWWIWLDGDETELDNVAVVEYHLHPTFPNPVREVTDRSRKFRLDAVGWGVFEIKARVTLTDGSVSQLSHMLELDYPADVDTGRGEAPTRSGKAEADQRSVFLSAGSADSALAADLRSRLTESGLHVWSDEDIPAGAPWDVEIEHAIGNADAVVAVSSDVRSLWVEREVGAATQQGTRVIRLVVGEGAVLPKSLGSFEQINVPDATAIDDATELILRAIDE